MRRWIVSLAILGIVATLLWIWNPFAPRSSEVSEPPSAKTVDRAAGATVVVKVVDSAGRPVSAVVSALPLASGGRARNFNVFRSGTARKEGLPSGKWLLSACTEAVFGGGAMGAIAQKMIDIPAAGELLVDLAPRPGTRKVEFEVRLPAGPWTANSPFVLPAGTVLESKADVMREMGAMPAAGSVFGTARAGASPTHFTLRDVSEGSYVVAVLIQREGASNQQAFSVPVVVSGAAEQSVVLTAPALEALIALDGY